MLLNTFGSILFSILFLFSMNLKSCPVVMLGFYILEIIVSDLWGLLTFGFVFRLKKKK